MTRQLPSSFKASSNNTKRTPCRFFASGSCRKGDKCRYSHEEASANNNRTSTQKPITQKTISSQSVLSKKKLRCTTCTDLSDKLLQLQSQNESGLKCLEKIAVAFVDLQDELRSAQSKFDKTKLDMNNVIQELLDEEVTINEECETSVETPTEVVSYSGNSKTIWGKENVTPNRVTGDDTDEKSQSNNKNGEGEVTTVTTTTSPTSVEGIIITYGSRYLTDSPKSYITSLLNKLPGLVTPDDLIEVMRECLDVLVGIAHGNQSREDTDFYEAVLGCVETGKEEEYCRALLDGVTAALADVDSGTSTSNSPSPTVVTPNVLPKKSSEGKPNKVIGAALSALPRREYDLTSNEQAAADDRGIAVTPDVIPKKSLESKHSHTDTNVLDKLPQKEYNVTSAKEGENESHWSCNVCTLSNPALYLICNACGSTQATQRNQPSPNEKEVKKPHLRKKAVQRKAADLARREKERRDREEEEADRKRRIEVKREKQAAVANHETAMQSAKEHQTGAQSSRTIKEKKHISETISSTKPKTRVNSQLGNTIAPLPSNDFSANFQSMSVNNTQLRRSPLTVKKNNAVVIDQLSSYIKPYSKEGYHHPVFDLTRNKDTVVAGQKLMVLEHDTRLCKAKLQELIELEARLEKGLVSEARDIEIGSNIINKKDSAFRKLIRKHYADTSFAEKKCQRPLSTLNAEELKTMLKDIYCVEKTKGRYGFSSSFYTAKAKELPTHSIVNPEIENWPRAKQQHWTEIGESKQKKLIKSEM